MSSHNVDLQVKVVEVCTVTPPSPATTVAAAAVTNESSLPLTHFDYMFVRYTPIQRLFFYQTSDEATTILPKLKQSLSVTLEHYLPLAGKLIWPQELNKPIIRYVEGDGVSLTVAEAREADDFHGVADGKLVLPGDAFKPLLPESLSTHGETPAIAVQVTFFGGKGFSIGYTNSHAVADGKSTAMFMHAWASTCRHNAYRLTTRDIPFYDRTGIQDPTNVGTRYLNLWLDQDGPNNKSVMMLKPAPLPLDIVRKTFSLTDEDIEHIKTSIHTQWQGKELVHLSTFTAIVAYVWVCLVKSRNTMVDEVDQEEKFHLVFAADARGRIQPPLPSTYFGNCIVLVGLAIKFRDLVEEDGVATTAKAIAKAIEDLKNGSVVGPRPETLKPELFLSPKDLITAIASSPKFKLYDVDFGWGKPKKVEVASINRLVFTLVESRDGNGGLEIGIVLRKHEMEIFSSLFARGTS